MGSNSLSQTRIPVVDLFAGPGGLGEGFSALRRRGRSPFEIALSIEKDAAAHRTLHLRAFFRQFERGNAPGEYYAHLEQRLALEDLHKRFPKQALAASEEAWLAELGSIDEKTLHRRVRQAYGRRDPWILIGGPPCQAYSLVGRSRNTGNPNFAKDHRHLLYREYLKIIARHWPPVFVMENVKGLLSATIEEQSTFQLILNDLRDPGAALGVRARFGYRIYPLAPEATCATPEDYGPLDFVVRSEKHGVPQRRHRVILVGVRTDVKRVPASLLADESHPTIDAAISGLPRLRSGVSDACDSGEVWRDVITEALNTRWFDELKETRMDVRYLIRDVARALRIPRRNRGTEFMGGDFRPRIATKWFRDSQLKGIVNHTTRSHMKGDLHRYLYASCFSAVEGTTPSLEEFPPSLLPNHRNLERQWKDVVFVDRFRVQSQGLPSTTVTSHIAKDGHYFIHFDPRQCRSLTVREAARLQTFPDNYLFCGPRTAQYQQVGNAVPPILATQIARSVVGLVD